jgi:hypothetical protein
VQTPTESTAAAVGESAPGGGDGPSYEVVAGGEPAPDSVPAGTETVAAATIPGEWVQSDTAGTGEAVNADTGEVTPPGHPLPTIEQQDGEPLTPGPQDTQEIPAQHDQNTD